MLIHPVCSPKYKLVKHSRHPISRPRKTAVSLVQQKRSLGYSLSNRNEVQTVNSDVVCIAISSLSEVGGLRNDLTHCLVDWSL